MPSAPQKQILTQQLSNELDPTTTTTETETIKTSNYPDVKHFIHRQQIQQSHQTTTEQAQHPGTPYRQMWPHH